jgi:hypothetical protein
MEEGRAVMEVSQILVWEGGKKYEREDLDRDLQEGEGAEERSAEQVLA